MADVSDPRFRTAIQVKFTAGEVKADAKIRNAGAGGLFVETTSLPETGETVRLHFRAPHGETIEVVGMVWWTTKRGEKHGSKRAGFGVRLLDPSDAYESMLKRHVLAPSCTHSTERSTVDRVADQDAAGPRSARGEGANGGARLRLYPRAAC